MKRFIHKVISFTFQVLILFYCRPLYLLYNNKYKITVAGNEIYLSIHKSKQKTKAKKLLLGDSVGRQLFPNDTNNDTINSLACNRSIGMIGQFILLNNYIYAGNEIDTLFMLFTPFSFSNNLNDEYTYHYFLKPFYTDEYRPLFTKTVCKEIDKIPDKFLLREPYVLTSNWAPDFQWRDSVTYTFLSPISSEYLTKIKELSIKHHFRIILLPVPVSLSRKPKIDEMNKNEILNKPFTKEFKHYFKNIIYLDDTCFRDGTHLKNPRKFRVFIKKI